MSVNFEDTFNISNITNADIWDRYAVHLRTKLKRIDPKERRDYEILFSNIKKDFVKISNYKVELRRNPKSEQAKSSIRKLMKEIKINIEYIQENLVLSVLCY